MRLDISASKFCFLPMSPYPPEQDRGKSPEPLHHPVLTGEVISSLKPRSAGFYLDATIGLGGHAAAILEASAPEGMLLGIDQDREALTLVQKTLSPYKGRYELVHANFSQLREILTERRIEKFDGVLVDLGVSSFQLDSAERGFSFQNDGPLDMRMDREHPLTAQEIVNHYVEKDLANLIFRFGEEPFSRKIARAIVKARPLRSTRQLAEVIAKATASHRYRRIHPATRTFQALRIFVNDELSRISPFIRLAAELLVGGGKIVVISFHSLEDRVVKETFRALSSECLCPSELPQCVCGNKKILRRITRKPIQPGQFELNANPRSRSAKLRVAEKL